MTSLADIRFLKRNFHLRGLEQKPLGLGQIVAVQKRLGRDELERLQRLANRQITIETLFNLLRRVSHGFTHSLPIALQAVHAGIEKLAIALFKNFHSVIGVAAIHLPKSTTIQK